MSQCNSNFWTENMYDLFCSQQIIPTTSMTNEQQMNALTRLTILLFIILLLLDYKYSFAFLLISLLLIIIIYYLQR